ncbi:hypothetical protein WJX84_000223 [Apatococcus fuscideae]|uniref:Uncharacterized protein n=1 Tax=Apatococcus fuscideae TaxID=2026836 RepID=A0AAW1T397_9CHLO
MDNSTDSWLALETTPDAVPLQLEDVWIELDNPELRSVSIAAPERSARLTFKTGYDRKPTSSGSASASSVKASLSSAAASGTSLLKSQGQSTCKRIRHPRASAGDGHHGLHLDEGDVPAPPGLSLPPMLSSSIYDDEGESEAETQPPL